MAERILAAAAAIVLGALAIAIAIAVAVIILTGDSDNGQEAERRKDNDGAENVDDPGHDNRRDDNGASPGPAPAITIEAPADGASFARRRRDPASYTCTTGDKPRAEVAKLGQGPVERSSPVGR